MITIAMMTHAMPIPPSRFERPIELPDVAPVRRRFVRKRLLFQIGVCSRRKQIRRR